MCLLTHNSRRQLAWSLIYSEEVEKEKSFRNVFSADYYSKGDRKQEEMKTFYIAFFSDFNHRSLSVDTERVSKSLLYLNKNSCTATLWDHYSMRSLRFVNPGTLMGKETKNLQEVNKLCNEGKAKELCSQLGCLLGVCWCCLHSPESQHPHL